jgi:hypothetical protein
MVTFETKCYENDWEFILLGNYLKRMIERCNYNFSKRTLLINNVNDTEKVSYYAQKKIKAGVITDFIIVEKYAEEVLNFFEIDKNSFNGGYYYSIAELTGIYVCKTKYLLHFSSDSLLQKNSKSWINEAIKIFEQRKDVLVANPTWDFRFQHAREESFDSTGNFFVGYGFSDQCYLVKAARLKQPIYNEKNIVSNRFPKYGGELFEKRIDSYMQNHRLVRITSKEVSYIHQNFPSSKKERFLKKLQILFGRDK